MIKPLWAGIAGVAFLGTVGAAAVVVAGTGGEEEIAPAVQQTASATPFITATSSAFEAPPTPSPAPTDTAPTSSPPTPAGWDVYADPEAGFSFPHPGGLTLTEQSYDALDKSGSNNVRVRTLSFRRPDGTPAISMAIAPNPNSLTLEEWIRTYPGWPSEPQNVTIAGEPALLFETNQSGQLYPSVYFRRGDSVFSISGNVFGASELGVSSPPGITESEFQRVRDGFRFDQ